MRILLVDAFPMVRAAIIGLIEQHFPGSRVHGVDTASAAHDALAQSTPELMLLDLRIDGGAELLRRVHHDRPALPVVVISGTESAEDALHTLGAGAMGYVPERSDLSTLAQALHLVLAGGTYVPPLKTSSGAAPPQAEQAPQDWPHLPLTPRQKHVLALLVQGLPNKLIARELGVSVDTVKDHVAAVLKALGVSSRTQAVVVATQKPR